MTEHLRQACARKVAHRTRENACAARKHAGVACDVYRCVVCGRWHIGTPTGHDLKRRFQGVRRRIGGAV